MNGKRIGVVIVRKFNICCSLSKTGGVVDILCYTGFFALVLGIDICH